MREQYMRQVEKALDLPRRAKKEVLRDLGEVFDSALEHGESEAEVAARLGSPQEFAAAAREQLEPKNRSRLGWAVSGALAVVAAAVLAAYISAPKPPEDAIGWAAGSTDIAVAGALPNLAPVIGIVLAAAAVANAVRLIRRRGR